MDECRLVKQFVINVEVGSELSVESETNREIVSHCARKISTYERKQRNFLLLLYVQPFARNVRTDMISTYHDKRYSNYEQFLFFTRMLND